jgi:aryl-alcohol dehydrogenase-like predicted oxidoreductase/histidinol phosphatase-like enzyme/predicted kinase
MWPTAEQRVQAIGCMRLSTAPGRDERDGIGVLHAALDAGVTLLDTADAYCRDATETGHNERLIAAALASWRGDRSRVIVASKGGLTRPEGRWVADGRARHLRDACRATLRALDIDRLPLYQLHAVDPRTPFATSVRALAALVADGLVERVGLSNVSVGQIEAARRIVPIASVQIELSVLSDGAAASGVVRYCLDHGLRVLAYRPLGGPEHRPRLERDATLRAVAARHRATPAEVALAWLLDLSPLVVPLPGPSRVTTVASIARAAALALTAEDREALDARFTHGRLIREGPAAAVPIAQAPARGEVVLIMGLPGAGKSTVAAGYVERGYFRLNRDDSGGSLKGLVAALERAIADGHSRIVLDNTYVSRRSRAPVIAAATRLGLPVRALWLATALEDAQVNAATRIVERYGRLLEPDEAKAATKTDVAAFGPTVQFRYQRDLEPPDVGEGFSQVACQPFRRVPRPHGDARGLIVWCDAILWRSRSGGRTPASADDVALIDRRCDTLRDYVDAGWTLLGMTWQPELADGTRSRADFDAAVERLCSLLGVPMHIRHCGHPAGPPICWCRKPLPGLGVLLMREHALDPAQSIYVGDGAQDAAFARRLGFQYVRADAFFSGGAAAGTSEAP